MITKVSHMTLYVRDQKQAYEVYVNKLGFKVSTDQTMENGMRWLTVTPPGQPDVEIVLAEPRAMKNKGIEFMKPPTKEFYGIEALFKDGCGNWFSMTEHEKK